MDVQYERFQKRSGSRARAGFCLALAIAMSAGYAAYTPVSAQQERAQLPTPADLSRIFIDVSKQVKPAVVQHRRC